MANQSFAVTPSVSISRSKFKRDCQHKTAFKLGEIVPIFVDADILPGDTVSMDLASLVRMSTPIVPIMDNIYIDYYAMWCPNRLVYDKWKNFMGENTSSYGAASDPGYPVQDIGEQGKEIVVGSIGDYMGLPYTTDQSPSLEVSALPGRAYVLIYNEWFRDQNLISPLAVTTALGTGSSALATDPNNSNAAYNYASAPLKAAKLSDYFTRSLPYAQKGAPVKLPLGTLAPVKTGTNIAATTIATGVPLKFAGASTGNAVGQVGSLWNASGGYLAKRNDSLPEGESLGTSLVPLNLYADLSNATAATINQLRFAFQYQKFLEKDALYGSRYWEILKGHFSIEAPDASLQRPEFLGHFRQNINIDQVLQTTGVDISTPSQNTLGATGANSVSGTNNHLFTKSFVEHGILMILAVARHDQTYGQGVNRMWSRRKREDFYFPVFANLGAQEVKRKEIFADGSSGDENIFGYQEAWAEYRYRPNQVSGILKPSWSNSLGYWTLANNFASAPTLSKSFIEQDRDNLARALVTGSSGPDFVADFYFGATYVRPMPMYSVPGLIDHH